MNYGICLLLIIPFIIILFHAFRQSASSKFREYWKTANRYRVLGTYLHVHDACHLYPRRKPQPAKKKNKANEPSLVLLADIILTVFFCLLLLVLLLFSVCLFSSLSFFAFQHNVFFSPRFPFFFAIRSPQSVRTKIMAAARCNLVPTIVYHLIVHI